MKLQQANWVPRTFGGICVRSLRFEDLPALYDDIEADPDVKSFIIGGPTKAQRGQWIIDARSLCEREDFYALDCSTSSEFVGRASLMHYCNSGEPGDLELQVLISKRFWRRGLGRDASRLLCDLAFDRLGATRVFAVVHPAHPRSATLASELGFEEQPEPDGDRRTFVLTRERFVAMA
jgi:RimJ/RimL family protein N-acetyltransferase